ncbi:MAG: thermonuclease family protein [Clostridia bacterium]|nr:thermonuclease family protein [Clostridia bacterium]
MKKFAKILVSLLCAAIFAVPALTACDNGNDDKTPTTNTPPDNTPTEAVDYVSQLKFNKNSDTKKAEVTVRLYVDGDTTHFDPVGGSSEFSDTQGYIKARYLAINTPESTGKIEEWGKAASKFTRSKLESAESIYIESDDSNWNLDSTGGRYLLWIWYKPQGASEYRNLNVEILQEGYALASATASGRYGSVATQALEQARKQKLHVYSGEKDPDFYYGDAIPLTMKELRCHIAEYDGTKVAVEGVIVGMHSNTAYVEDYDEDEGICFGISVYYGATASGDILGMSKIGNRVRYVGTVSYYEAGGTYQISGVSYNAFKPELTTNSKLISEGHESTLAEIDVTKLNDNLTINFETEKDDNTVEVEEVTIKLGEAMMSTSVALNDLEVLEVYTTDNGGNSDGAMSLTCQTKGGATIVVRTAVLKAKNGKTVTADAFDGKTISVKGIIDKFKNTYQVFCYSMSQITIAD